MKKFAKFILKSKYINIVVFVVLLAVATFGMLNIKINSDLLSYIPKTSDTSVGKAKLVEQFDIVSDFAFAVDGDALLKKDEYANWNLTDDELLTYRIRLLDNKIKRIKNLDQYVASVSWIGDLAGVRMLDQAKFEIAKNAFYKNGDFLVIVMLKYKPSDKKCAQSIAKIQSIMNEEHTRNILDKSHTYKLNEHQLAYGGTAYKTVQIYNQSISELPFYLGAAVLLVLIILLITSRSYVEPLIFLATLGISIFINMGTNFIFGKPVSIITFCAAGVLQLALAMDYAIFLTHAYYDKRSEGLNAKDSLIGALPTTFTTVISSALTTMGGFFALFFMKFRIGLDLGSVLLKGILLALLTVVFLQPVLILILNKAIDKTQKKFLHFKFKALSKATVKFRWYIAIGFFILIIPVFLIQFFNLKYTYLEFMETKKAKSELTQYVDDLGKQTFIITPVKDKDYSDQYEFLDKLNKVENIDQIKSAFTFLPSSFLQDASMRSLAKSLLNDDYALYMIAFKPDIGGVEKAKTQQTVEEIRNICNDHWGQIQKDYYLTGVPQGIRDFKIMVPKDFLVVSIISIAVVFIILMINYRSLKYPILLVMLIQFGIWLNLCISCIIGKMPNFASYLTISSIQLGATVDYAILTTTKYRENRAKGLSPKESAKFASQGAAMSVLTSATIMVCACLSVYFIASNMIVKEIAGLIARGAVISCILVLCVLPSILSISEPSELKRKMRELKKEKKLEKKAEKNN